SGPGTWTMQAINPDGSRSNVFSFTVGAATISNATNDYPYASAVADTIDPYDFYVRECTSFIAWRMNRDAGTVDPSHPSFFNRMKGGHWGNAGNWSSNAALLNYLVDSNPQVGAIAQWGPNECIGCTFGHVAYVEAVNSDGTVNVSEYNFLNSYAFDSRARVSPPRFIHFH
ncbi:MAG: CHAP domain-containing protein, partial [Terriglobales bacterium]